MFTLFKSASKNISSSSKLSRYLSKCARQPINRLTYIIYLGMKTDIYVNAHKNCSVWVMGNESHNLSRTLQCQRGC